MFMSTSARVFVVGQSAEYTVDDTNARRRDVVGDGDA
jgi:hypothetical protein